MAPEIVIYHVGGGDNDDGPTRYLAKAGFKVRHSTVDARDGVCVSDREGDAVFSVNNDPLSSSLYRTNPARGHEVCPSVMNGPWANVSGTRELINVKTTTIDALFAGKEAPDVLSIDAQGAELDILRGAAHTLRDVLCVVAEVEFAPIYEGQALYEDQALFLRPYNFRLMELFCIQHWFHGRALGAGMITVAEAAWLRHDYASLDLARRERLAMIAFGFGRMAYGLEILASMDERFTDPTLVGMWKLRDELHRL